MAYESVDAHEGEGRAQWESAGSPVLPSLAVDGVVTPILHVSQIAGALGLPSPQGDDATRLAWELLSTLDRWLALIRPLSLEQLTAPTESRGRSIRNLTVNVCHPIELLPDAWETGFFPWDPEGDDEREASLASSDDVIRYAEVTAGHWTGFLLASGEDLSARDPLVTSPRGAVAYSELLASQAFHATFHLRQIEAACSHRGNRGSFGPR